MDRRLRKDLTAAAAVTAACAAGLAVVFVLPVVLFFLCFPQFLCPVLVFLLLMGALGWFPAVPTGIAGYYWILRSRFR